MSESLGELLLEIGLSPTQALKDLEAFKKDAMSHAKDIEKSLKLNLNLKPIVDESQLTSLNKHLDLKQRHFKQVQGYFNSNPLTVRTNTSQLDSLEARLNKLKTGRHSINIEVKQNTVVGSTKVASVKSSTDKATVKLDDANFNKFGDAVTKGTEKHFSNLIKEVSKSGKGSAIGAVFKAVASPFQAVGRGALEGVGREASRELSKGVSAGIERELSYVLGSFDLVGKELGKELVAGILDSMGRDAQMIEKVFSDVLGKTNVARAGAAVRGKQSNQNRADSNIAGQQAAREYGFVRDNIGDVKRFGQAVENQQNELKAKAEALQNQIFELESKLGLEDLSKALESKVRDLQTVNREIARAAEVGDTEKLTTLKIQSGTISSDIDSYTNSIERVRDMVDSTFKTAIQDIKLAEDDLAVQERKLSRYTGAVENFALLDVPENMAASNPTVAKASDNKSKQARQISRFYKDVVDEVGAASGVDIASGDIPRLVASNLPKGVNAAYLGDSNTVQVSPEVLEAINQGTVTNKQLETLVHELRHAVQSDFGRVLGEKSPIDLIRPNNEEAKRLGSLIEKSTKGGRGGDSTHRREIEADAYVFADRQTSVIQERLSKNQALRGLDETVGVGGGSLQEQLKVTQLKALKLMTEIKSASPVDMTTATQDVLTKFDSINDDFIKALDVLSGVEDLPVEEIKAIQDALVGMLADAKKAVLVEVKSFQNLAKGEPLALSQPEREAVLVENTPKAAANTMKMAVNDKGESVPYDEPTTGAPKQAVKLSNQAKISTPQSLNISPGMGPTASLEKADIIAKSFWESYQAINQAVKDGDVNKANNLLAYVKELGDKAKGEIKELTDSLGQDAKFGTELGNKLANRKGQITKAVKQSEQQLIKLASSMNDGGNVSLSTESIETLLNQARQGLIDGTIEDVDTFFDSIKIDELPNAESVLDDDIAYAMEDIKKLFEQYIENLTSGKGIPVIDADLKAAEASARFMGNADKFDRAESNINERAAKAEVGVARNLAGLDSDIGGTETLLSRINRLLKSEGILGGEGVLKGIKEQALGVLKGFMGYASIGFISKLFMDFSAHARQSALEMTKYREVLQFVLGDVDLANEKINEIKAQAKLLGGDFRAGIQGYTSFAGASLGTPLEGEQADNVFFAIQQAAGVFELDADTTARAMLALQQMMSKGSVQAEELRGQLGEALPGAFNIAARSMGVTTGELSKMLELGQVASTEFLPKFAQQLTAETDSGVSIAADSIVASINNYNSAIFSLQEAFGKPMLNVQKVGLDLAVNVLELVTRNAEMLSAAFSVLGLTIASSLLGPVKMALAALGLMPSSFAAVRAGIMATTKAMIPFLAKTVLLYAAIKAGAAAFQLFQDASGEVGNIADGASRKMDLLRQSLDDIALSGKDAVDNLKNLNDIGNIKVGGAIGSLDILRSDNKKQVGLVPDLNPVTQLVNFVSRRQANRQQTNTLDATDRIGEQTGNASEIANYFLAGSGRDKLDEFKQVDAAIDKMQQKLRAMKALNPEDIESAAKLEEKINKELEKRGGLIGDITKARQGVDDMLLIEQNAIEALDDMLAKGTITPDTYNDAVGKIKPRIEELEKLQSSFNDELDSTATSLEKIARNLRDVGATFSDATRAASRLEVTGRRGIAEARLAGASEGQVQTLSSQLENQTLQLQLTAAQKAIADVRAILSDPIMQDAVNAMGGDRKLRGLGGDTLNSMREDIGDKDPAMTRALDAYIQLDSLGDEVNNIQTSITEAAANAKDRLTEMGKAITDYYKGIQDAFESTMLDVKSTLAQANFDSMKAGLTNAISGITDNFLGSYFDVITSTLESIFDGIMDSLNTSKQIADINNQLQGVLNQGNELFGQANTSIGSIGEVSSGAVQNVVQEANSWDGREFNKGVRAQCAFFVNEVFKRSGIELGNNGSGLAASYFDGRTGQVQHTRDPNSIPAGAIVGFENTYDGPGSGVGGYTHVGVATGNGRMVDRSTSARPVSERAITTFRADARGGYSYVVPNSLIQSSGALNQTGSATVQPGNATGQRPSFSMNNRSSIEAAIVQESMRQGVTDANQIAYILATARHESDNFQTLTEYASGSAYEGRRDLGNTQRGDGQRFKGRGFVQLTGRANYEKYSELTGQDLVGNPELAADPQTALFTLVHGMRTGAFTGRGLNDFGQGANFDARQARRTVNGMDRADLIAGYSRDYLQNGTVQNAMAGGIPAGASMQQADTSGIIRGQNLALQGANAQIDAVQQSQAARDALRTAQINLNTRKLEQQALQDARRREDEGRTRGRELEDRSMALGPQNAETKLAQDVINLQRQFEDSNRDLMREMEDMQLSSKNADAQIAAFNTAIDALIQQGANPEQIQAIRTQIGILETAQSALQPELDARREYLGELAALHDQEIAQLVIAGEIAIEAERISKLRSRLNFDRQTTEPAIELMRRSGNQTQANQMEFNLEIDEIDLAKLEQLNALRQELLDGIIDEEEYNLRVTVVETDTENRLQLQRQNAARTTNDQSLRDERAIFDSNSAVANAGLSLADTQGYGGSYAVTQLREQMAVASEQLRFQEQLHQIQNDATLSADAIAKLTENATLLNQINLQQVGAQFSEMTELMQPVQQGMEGFFSSILDGSKTIGEAFGDMVNSILAGLAKIVAQKLVSGLLGGMMGGGGLFGGLLGGGGGGGLLGGLFKEGGYVPNYAKGGMVGNMSIQDAMTREGSGAMLAVVNNKEAILTEAHQKIVNGALAFQGLSLDKVFAGGFREGGFVGSPASAGVNLSQTNQTKSSGNITIPINIQSSGNSEDDSKLAATLSSRVEAVVLDVVNRETKYNGILYKG